MPSVSQPAVAEPDLMPFDPANPGSVDPQSVEGLFLTALGKSGDDRASFLDCHCPDPVRRQRVHALLNAYERAGDFLQKPALAAEPTSIGPFLSRSEVPGTLGRLGAYEILEEIGRGGMGVVFRARDLKLQRIVAVKALAPELARQASARQRFLREARAAAAISHPHVVTIFAVEGLEDVTSGTQASLPFLVMECIVGQTLQDKIKRVGALRIEEIVRISRQIAEGLASAHNRGLIHRDIKPANILLENGVERVRITDFGLARTMLDGGITHTGEILGTPQCMSPEQARGEIVDQRSDLFSLGCVMYTMCTGVNPFRGDNILAVMKKVCEETPQPISQINPAIPTWLCKLVDQLLEKVPESRVQTAEDVVQSLESHSTVTTRPVPAENSSPVLPTVHANSETQRASLVTSSESALNDLGKSFIQWEGGLLVVALVSFVAGTIIGNDRYTNGLLVPIAAALVWGSLLLIRRMIALPGRWIHWKSAVFSVLALMLGVYIESARSVDGYRPGGVKLLVENLFGAAATLVPLLLGTYWLASTNAPELFRSASGDSNPSASDVGGNRPVPEGSRRDQLIAHWANRIMILVACYSGGHILHRTLFHSMSAETVAPWLFVLVLATMFRVLLFIAMFIVRMFRNDDAQYLSTTSSGETTVKLRTPWRVLEWIVAVAIGVAVLAGLGFATVVIVSFLPPPEKVGFDAWFVVRTPGAENVKSVSIDGTNAILEPGGPGEWRIRTTPGNHGIYVVYDSDWVLQQERFFVTTASVARGETTIIAAEPVMVRSLIRPPGIEASSPTP